MRHKALPLVLALGVFLILPLALHACMWDYDTLKMERSRFPDTLELITGKFLRHSPEFYQWRIKNHEERLKDHPSEPGLYDDLGVAYDKIGNDDKAIEIMQQKEQLAPGLYETYANLGTFYLHSGQYDKGIAMIDKALVLNPDAHFGREKYQKYLAKYVAARVKDGKVTLPLSSADDVKQRNFAAFLIKKDSLDDAERDRAIKGILGIMKFGKHDSPIILEVLADLLVRRNGQYPSGKGKELAGRAYLKASYEVKEEQTKDQYRELASTAIGWSMPGGSTLTLDQMEVDFKKELSDADAWYADLREKELGWIRNGQDPEAEFDKLYTAEPSLVSPAEDYYGPQYVWSRTLLIGCAILVAAMAMFAGMSFLLWRRLRRSSHQ